MARKSSNIPKQPREVGFFFVTLAAFLFVFFAGALVTFPSTQNTQFTNAPLVSTATAPGTAGWDYGLKRRCIRSLLAPSISTYYTDTTDCFDTTSYYGIANESEKTAGQSCAGTPGMTFGVNKPNSPLSLSWTKNSQGFYTVTLTSDMITKPNPCGTNYYNWYYFSEPNMNNGANYPAVNEGKQSMTLKYTQDIRSGTVRVIAGAQFYWDNAAHLIEINLYSPNWADGFAEPNGENYVLYKASNHGGYLKQYIVLYGPSWGYTVTPGQTKTMTIDWYPIIQKLIQKGYFTGSSQGYDPTKASIMGYGVGYETINYGTTNTVKAVLEISGWRIESVSSNPIGYVDRTDCTKIYGWTCDPNDYNSPLDVHFYANAPAGITGTSYLGMVRADVVRTDVGPVCGGKTAHGFEFTIPAAQRNNKQQLIYAYGINVGAGNNTILTQSPITFSCAPAPQITATTSVTPVVTTPLITTPLVTTPIITTKTPSPTVTTTGTATARPTLTTTTTTTANATTVTPTVTTKVTGSVSPTTSGSPTPTVSAVQGQSGTTDPFLPSIVVPSVTIVENALEPTITPGATTKNLSQQELITIVAIAAVASISLVGSIFAIYELIRRNRLAKMQLPPMPS